MPKVLFLYPNLPLMQVIPTAITSLSAYLKQRGVMVDLFDTTLYKLMPESPDELRVKLCQNKPFRFSDAKVEYKTTDMKKDFDMKMEFFQPHVLAISANDFTHKIAENLIEGIHDKYPDLHVIMGGMYPTFFPLEARKHREIDSICIGEGYETLYEVAKYVEDKLYFNLSRVQNLHVKIFNDMMFAVQRPIQLPFGRTSPSRTPDVRDHEPKLILENSLRQPIDINTLPFDDFDLFEPTRHYRPMFGKMLKILPFWFDLGCPYGCTYCSAPSLRQLYLHQTVTIKNPKRYDYKRCKTMPRIVEELDYQIAKHKPEFIYFSSETFFARPKRHIREFAEYYKKIHHIPFWCETRVETVNDENAQILHDMGCARVSIGLESGNERYRMDVLNKKFTNQQFVEAIHTLKRHHIKVTINNIIGLPDETRSMVFDTIRVNKDVSDRDVNQVISTFVPTGGSALQKYCLEKKYFDLNEYLNMPYGGFHLGTYLKMPQLSPEDVLGLLRTFPMYVKMPDALWSNITMGETDDKMYEKLKKLYWRDYGG